MSFIINTPNPFQPLDGIEKHVHPGGVTVREWLETEYPGFVEFDQPTICVLNGQPLMRKDWNHVIAPNDVVNFIRVIGIPLIIIAIILIAISVALSLTIGAPETPGETPASDPVFSIKGQSNQIRLGEPIEVNYGRNRIFPSLASRPFYQYIDNDQFQYSLYCIGQGQYEIEAVQIGDTAIENFQEVEYEVLEPDEQSTLFKTNVFTSAEVGGQTLFPHTDVEYVAPGWIGPFVACPIGDETSHIEVDLVFPRGIYRTGKDGGLKEITVSVEIEARLIDDDGNPLGPFFFLFDTDFPGTTTTPQRKTLTVDVSEGRYEVRARRTDTPFDTTVHKGRTVGDQIVWEGLRSSLAGVEPDFGDVTLMAVKIKATNNLNARTREKFNVIATRKLRVRDSATEAQESDVDSAGFTESIVSRSIVWAFVDVFRSTYGGKITDEFFDWDTLEELDAFYEARGEHFDWTFRDAITVWEAAKTIARAGRAVPLLSGSLITMRRDGPLEIPVTMFSPDNIIKGSFQWDVKLWEPNEADSILIEYTEPETGYKQENVLCILPGDDSDAGGNSKDLRLPGVQDRDHAYREGLFILASERYLRENVTFETGMEGHIPSFGDLIAVSHDVPRWGQSGYILAVERQSPGDSILLYVSEPLSFDEDSSGSDYVVMLRDKSSTMLGPFNAQATDDPKVIEVTIDEGSEEIDFLLDGRSEPMLFLFGVSGRVTEYLKVVKVEPQGGERVRITAVNENPTIHSFDDLTAPALNTTGFPPLADGAPEIAELFLSRIDGIDYIIQATWRAAFGAQYYIVQISYDGENWENKADTVRTSVQMQVRPGLIYVRVAAVNEGQGPWIQDTITVGIVAGLHIEEDWECLHWTIGWWENINIDGWLVRVYSNTESGPVLKHEELLDPETYTFTYTWAMAVDDDNLVREHLVTVQAMVIDDITQTLEEEVGSSDLELSNAPPALPSEDSSGAGSRYELSDVSSDFTEFTWRLFWDNPPECDLHCIAIWIDQSETFDPSSATPYLEECVSEPGSSPVLPTEAFVITEVDSDMVHPDYFYWIAVYDAWGHETEIAGPFPFNPPWILEDGYWLDYGRWEDDDVWKPIDSILTSGGLTLLTSGGDEITLH